MLRNSILTILVLFSTLAMAAEQDTKEYKDVSYFISKQDYFRMFYLECSKINESMLLAQERRGMY